MGERKGSGQGAILTEAQEALAMALAVEIGRRREATGTPSPRLRETPGSPVTCFATTAAPLAVQRRCQTC
jgi:hypothetical protein